MEHLGERTPSQRGEMQSRAFSPSTGLGAFRLEAWSLRLGLSETQGRDLVRAWLKVARRPKDEPAPDDAQVHALAQALVRLLFT